MKRINHLVLAPYTSFHCGGEAETALIQDEIAPLTAAEIAPSNRPTWFLGFGANTLISDRGLPGTTYILRAGQIERQGTTLIADAGVWWDDLVQYAINRNLWGLEFMSAIPGNVGAGIVGNIAAYGQAVADTLQWAEVLDTQTGEMRRLDVVQLEMTYRNCKYLQSRRHLLVLRGAFGLSPHPTKQLEYDSALVVATEKNYDLTTLAGRRDTIVEARRRAGSLWDYRDEHAMRTAGSFFRNPMVAPDVAERIMSYDETHKSLELLRKMNTVHGGDATRVSAAHVLLAAGYQRGQSWGDVRLHPSHVLKLENAGNASAQDIYNAAHEIMATVRAKLGVQLDPEVRFLGEFDSSN